MNVLPMPMDLLHRMVVVEFCACFDEKVLFYVPSGKETRPGYLTKENSYVNKLSSAKIHVRQKRLYKNTKKVKDVFK